jgi:site-specific DNA-cytosine methylase
MTITAFYNDIEPYCCAWLSNLMDTGLITPGVISDKSIEDIFPDELVGFNRVHMFAGIGIWDYALDIAGWGDRQVWTGSCACQPFSEAGKGAGFNDERHLWPAWQWLIKERRPAIIFGEQVASKLVGPWVDLVHADLEGLGYAFGGVPFPSASIGSPHIRDRFYWMAYADHAERRTEESSWNVGDWVKAEWNESNGDAWQRLHGPDWQAFAASFCSDADGDKPRLAQLRAFGNAINPVQAAEFIRAGCEVIGA